AQSLASTDDPEVIKDSQRARRVVDPDHMLAVHHKATGGITVPSGPGPRRCVSTCPADACINTDQLGKPFEAEVGIGAASRAEVHCRQLPLPSERSARRAGSAASTSRLSAER